MRQQLIQYVDLLFAGTADCDEIKQEILQNTLDRYDDLVAEGKVPQAAYRLAIAGIGDISEILGFVPQPPASPSAPVQKESDEDPKKKQMRAIAIGIYIIAAIPLILLGSSGFDIWGLSITLFLVGLATALLIANGSEDRPVEGKQRKEKKSNSPADKLKESIHSLIWILGTAAYFLISFTTGGWYITWLMFPITGALQGLIDAILDLKEVIKHES